MTKTITITRCNHCPLYSPEDIEDCTPDMCMHEDSGWAELDPYGGPDNLELVFPKPLSIPPNCPLLQTPVTYRAERKS